MAIKYFVYNSGRNFEASLILSYHTGGFQCFNDLLAPDMIHTSSLHLCLQTFEQVLQVLFNVHKRLYADKQTNIECHC